TAVPNKNDHKDHYPLFQPPFHTTDLERKLTGIYKRTQFMVAMIIFPVVSPLPANQPLKTFSARMPPVASADS
ncbi:hypothetical protein, partial [Marinobacter sp. HN1S83]|uniref:hypothetical protein n=1 Tax=Marinobacter sp. HN1S83 TaxID=3382301 RepID=UPI00387B8D22